MPRVRARCTRISSRSPYSSVEQRAAERERKLRDDPMAIVIGPMHVDCKGCGNRIKLSTKSSYDTSNWRRHRSRCQKKHTKVTGDDGMRLKAPDPETVDSTIQRYDTSYPDDIHFAFGNKIFKLPKFYHQKFLIFSEMFTDVQKMEFTGNGTLVKPFGCQGVKQETFTSLLRILSTTANNDMGKVTRQEWKDILELASRWKVEQVVDIAVHHLIRMELEPITKLELAKKYNIQEKEWRSSAIHELIKDDMQLTEGQANLIGYDVALKIARMQGMIHGEGKQPFGSDDDWKLFMKRLAKEEILKDRRKFSAQSRLMPGYKIVRATLVGLFCCCLVVQVVGHVV